MLEGAHYSEADKRSAKHCATLLHAYLSLTTSIPYWRQQCIAWYTTSKTAAARTLSVVEVGPYSEHIASMDSLICQNILCVDVLASVLVCGVLPAHRRAHRLAGG
jgi:hypothetical protein